MTVTVNGENRDDLTTVADAVEATTTAERGIAVAVNGEVVPKSQWQQKLEAGDKVEVLSATQGG